ncbi:C1galt1p [Mactra antiquata]
MFKLCKRDNMVDLKRLAVNIRTVVFIGTFLIPALLYFVISNHATSNVRSYQTIPKWTSELYESTDSAANNRKRLSHAVQKVRLLCVIMTMEKDLATKVAAVNDTWVPRCDKYLYIITTKEKRNDFMSLDIPDKRQNLALKMRKVFTTIYEQYMDQFDYVLKCDDDTYVIVENLKFLLWHYDANKPSYFGFHFNKFIDSGYMSGGAGYVISNKGIRLLVERGYQHGVCDLEKHEDDPDNSEDVETGRCLQTVGVPPLSSLDADGRETFHPYPLERHLDGHLPGFMFSWAKHSIRKGDGCCSKYSISFHYVPPHAIYYLHHVLYKTTVFGLNHDEDLIRPVFNSENVVFETR